jgi:hypothetical protein
LSTAGKCTGEAAGIFAAKMQDRPANLSIRISRKIALPKNPTASTAVPGPLTLLHSHLAEQAQTNLLDQPLAAPADTSFSSGLLLAEPVVSQVSVQLQAESARWRRYSPNRAGRNG